jgi:iron(III) transport system permease protein
MSAAQPHAADTGTEPRHRIALDFWRIMTFLTVAVFVLLLAYPLLRMIVGSLVGSASTGQDVWQVYVDIFTKPYYYEALINSIVLSLGATLGAMVVGIPMAYVVYRFNIPGKVAIRAAIVLTFVAPPFIGAYSWILLLGNTGVIRNQLLGLGIEIPSIYGWFGLLLVLTIQGMPFIFLMTSSALKTVDQNVEDAAINLGHRPLKALVRAILPLLAPAVSTGALLVFVTSFADFGTPAIIGQNLRVFPRLVYNEFINETTGSDFTVASSLSVVLLLVSMAALLLQRRYAQRRSYGVVTVNPLVGRRLSRGPRLLATVFVYSSVLLASLPLLTVVVTSFLKTRRSVVEPVFTLDGYLHAPRLWGSFGRTMLYTSVATIMCVVAGCVVGYIVARQRTRLGAVIDLASMVPYAVAGVVLGIAFSMSFGGEPFFLAGSALILVLAYFTRRLPYAIRSVAGMLSQIGTSAEEASVNLGTKPAATLWRITVPMTAPAIVSGALLTWATIIREFNATVILYGPNTSTMSVEVFRHVLAGNFGDASVVGTVLIAASLVPIVILFRVLGKDEDFVV